MQIAGAGILTQPLLAQEHEQDTAPNLPASNSVWKPIFLSTEQNKAVIALGDGIIPGSRKASCNRIIDLVLSIESKKAKTEFLDSLTAFDTTSRQLYGRSLADLPASELTELLTQASAPANSLRPHFDLMKEWLADTYWSAQQGLRELGWTGRVAWTHFDGCSHGGSHI
jgi:hypothetical protein